MVRHLDGLQFMELGARLERLGPHFDASKPLNNPRKELFLQRLVYGDPPKHPYPMNQTRAFIAAGFSPHGARQNASRLMKRDDIRARYEHLMGQKAPVLDMKEVVTAGLLETVDVSKIRRTPTTMLRALRNLSRLHGFRV
jgi:hypothetical protein